MDEELQYKIAISMFQGIGTKKINQILEYYGSERNFYQDKSLTPELKFSKINISTKKETLIKAEKELNFCKKNGIRVLCKDDKEYPERLKYCSDAPHVLYCKGETDLNCLKTLSVVGTRRATDYGRNICKKIIGELADMGHDVLIISGLAYGIDIASHKAAIDNTLKTVGVVAHPLNTLYPMAHKNTATKMIQEGGAIVSDFPTFIATEPQNFLKRNRIIAGMADATLVVESAEKGGALITATLASSYGREVYAVPGRVNDNYSLGCNHLIKTNIASLVESAKDIEYLTGWKPNIKDNKKELALFPEMDKEEECIYSIIVENDKISMNNISNISKIELSKLSAILLRMEIKNIVSCLPGSRYCLKP